MDLYNAMRQTIPVEVNPYATGKIMATGKLQKELRKYAKRLGLSPKR